VGPWAGLDGRKISSAPGLDPGPPARSQSLYRLSYTAMRITYLTQMINGSFFFTVRKTGLEGNTDNTKYAFISREQYTRQNYDAERGNKSIEKVVNFI